MATSSNLLGRGADHRSSPWRVVVRFLLFILPGLSGGAAEVVWRTTSTEHFRVLSSAPEKQTRQLVVDLEQFRASFIATFNLPSAIEPKVTVVIFDSDKRFTPFKPLYRGRPLDVSGYILGGPDDAFIGINAEWNAGGEDTAKETIYHEYVHLLLKSRDINLPTWLNEGLAELFSTFEVEGGRVKYGLIKQHYVDGLKFRALMSMDELNAIDESSPVYNEAERAGIFYAQSWALAHLLVCGEDRSYAARLRRFLAVARASDAKPAEVFRQMFGADFKKLDDDLRAYLSGGAYYTRYAPVPLTDLGARLAVLPATEREQELTLLKLRWYVRQPADTMQRALQLAERFPQDPGPHEVLGEVMMAEKDTLRAQTHWRLAAERGSDAPSVLVAAARARIGELGARPDPDVRWPEADSAQLRDWLDRALRHNPLAEDATELLALVEANSRELRANAINTIQSRVAGLKKRHPTLLALAVIRYRVADHATAREILLAVQESSVATAETKQQARELLDRLPPAPAGDQGKPAGGDVPRSDEFREKTPERPYPLPRSNP